MSPILEACNITKQFPGVLANDGVSFSVERGEIHVLLGENGAGKTTLMNILYGLQSKGCWSHSRRPGEVWIGEDLFAN